MNITLLHFDRYFANLQGYLRILKLFSDLKRRLLKSLFDKDFGIAVLCMNSELNFIL